MKKPSTYAIVNRPSLEYDSDLNFTKLEKKFVESTKSAEKYEYTRVLEYFGSDKSLNKEIFDGIMKGYVTGHNRKQKHAPDQNLICLECIMMNLNEFSLEKGDFSDYDRENMSSCVAMAALQTLFNTCKTAKNKKIELNLNMFSLTDNKVKDLLGQGEVGAAGTDLTSVKLGVKDLQKVVQTYLCDLKVEQFTIMKFKLERTSTTSNKLIKSNLFMAFVNTQQTICHEKRLLDYISLYSKDRNCKSLPGEVSKFFEHSLRGYSAISLIFCQNLQCDDTLSLKQSIESVNFFSRKCLRLTNDGTVSKLKLIILKMHDLNLKKLEIEAGMEAEDNSFMALETENNALKTERKDIEAKVSALEDSLLSKEAELKALLTQISEKENLKKTQELRYNQLEKDLDNAFDEDKIVEAKSVINEQQHKSKIIEVKNNQLLKEYESICKKINNMNNQVEQQGEIEKNLIETNATLEQSATTLNQKIQESVKLLENSVQPRNRAQPSQMETFGVHNSGFKTRPVHPYKSGMGQNMTPNAFNHGGYNVNQSVFNSRGSIQSSRNFFNHNQMNSRLTSNSKNFRNGFDQQINLDNPFSTSKKNQHLDFFGRETPNKRGGYEQDMFTPKSDISMLEIENSYKLMEKDKKIMKLKSVRDKLNKEMRHREEKMNKLNVKIGVYENGLDMEDIKGEEQGGISMANSTAGWMDNMSELGSENMSTASLSLAGTLKARKKMSLINKYLGKRGFDDLGGENIMPYTCIKTLKLDIHNKPGLKIEKKYLNSKLTLLKNNLIDKKNHEDFLFRRGKELAMVRRNVDENVVLKAQRLISEMETC